MSAEDRVLADIWSGKVVGTDNISCRNLKELIVAPEMLRESFYYDHETGHFYWRTKTNGKRTQRRAGTRHCKGYWVITINKKRFLAHRAAWAYFHGEWPDNEIDHINHIRGDNRIENLRAVNAFENKQNMSIHASNKSGITGVSFYGSKNRWVAEIKANGVKEYLLQTPDFFEAVCARKSAENKLGFHENHGNKIKGMGA